MDIQIKRVRGKRAMLGGVASGLSDYLKVDATIIRILLLALIVSPIPVVLIYIISWVLLPVLDERNYLMP